MYSYEDVGEKEDDRDRERERDGGFFNNENTEINGYRNTENSSNGENYYTESEEEIVDSVGEGEERDRENESDSESQKEREGERRDLDGRKIIDENGIKNENKNTDPKNTEYPQKSLLGNVIDVPNSMNTDPDALSILSHSSSSSPGKLGGSVTGKVICVREICVDEIEKSENNEKIENISNDLTTLAVTEIELKFSTAVKVNEGRYSPEKT